MLDVTPARVCQAKKKERMGQKKNKSKLQHRLALSHFCNATLQFCRLYTTKGKNDTPITLAGFWMVMPKSRGSSWNEHAVEIALDTDAFLLSLCGDIPFTSQ